MAEDRDPIVDAPAPARWWRAPLLPPASRRRVGDLLRPHRRVALAAVACSLVQAALAMAPALVLRSLIDDLERRRDSFAAAGLLVAAGLAAIVAATAVGAAGSRLAVTVSKRVVTQVRQSLFDHLASQSVGYFTDRHAGDLLSRLMNDVTGIDLLISSSLMVLLSAGCMMVASLCVMVVLCWQLTIVTVALFPLVAVVVRLAGRALYQRRRSVLEQMSRMTVELQELLQPAAIMVIKVFGRQERQRRRFSAINEQLRVVETSEAMAGRWIGLMFANLQFLGPVVLLLVGSGLVVHGVITVGTLISFAAVAAIGFGMASQGLANGAASVIGSTPMWERIFEVLDHPVDVVEHHAAEALSGRGGRLRFEGVSFVYPGAASPALEAVSFSVAPGRLVALVGPSGAGKSTAVSLVARFYDPTGGRVTIDGTDLRHVTLGSLADTVGVVLQDTFLFHASIRDNLLLARPDASAADLAAVVDACALGELVAGLPHGLDTVVGERGHRLSGGERQRLALARVMLRDPPIVVLDEATSHLDSRSEALVHAAMSEVFRRRTSLVIAHRLSTVRAADLIVVLERGRVVEQGTHDELRRAGGLYAELARLQFGADTAVAAAPPPGG